MARGSVSISRRKGQLGAVVPRGAVVLMLAYLVLGPLLVLIFVSFRRTDGTLPFDPASTWSLHNFVEVFGNERTWALLKNTALLSAGALIIAFTISLIAAWFIERTDIPLRNSLFVLVIASMGIPGFISSIGWILLLNDSNGVINVWIRDVFGMDGDGPFNITTLPGMIFVEGLGLVPVTFLLLTAAFRALDSTMEEAAAMSGARPSLIARKITLPLLAPALLGTLVYQLATTIESFDIPLTIGLRGGIGVLPTEVYLQAQPEAGLPNYGLASTYGLFLIAIVVVPLVYYERLISRTERYATVSGNTYRLRRVNAKPWVRLLGVIVIGGYLLLEFILPALIIIYASFQPFYTLPTWESIMNSSTRAYRTAFADPDALSMLWNTLKLGLIAGLLTMAFSTAVSWIIVRTRSRLRTFVDILAFMPHAIPAMVLALALALIYVRIDLPIYATVAILVIALGTRYISLATRQMNSGIGSLRAELEEAGTTSGASPIRVLIKIVMPLAFPSFLNGFLLVTLLSMKNLVVPLMLGNRDSRVFSIAIWNWWSVGDVGTACALAVILMAFTVLLGFGLRQAAVRNL